MGKIESWKNKKILISQEEYGRLDEDQKEAKYSSEERAVRNTTFLGMNSTWARYKAINLMNEGKELTVEFLIQQLEIEDCNAQHKSLSQLDSTTSVNFAAYDCRQNRGKSNKSK